MYSHILFYTRYFSRASQNLDSSINLLAFIDKDSKVAYVAVFCKIDCRAVLFEAYIRTLDVIPAENGEDSCNECIFICFAR